MKMKNERTVKEKKVISILTALLVFLAMMTTVLPEKTWAAETITDAEGNQYSINAGTQTLTLTRGIDQKAVSIPKTVNHNGTDYTVTAVKGNAFPNCDTLKEITFPNSVISTGNYVFSGCDNLEIINFPESITSIGMLSRANTLNLSMINVNPANPNYESADGVLFDKGKKTLICYPEGRKDASYIIPNSVISLDKWAFSDALSLEEVIIPDSVTTISSSFYLCTGLKEITIPKNVSSIQSDAFYGCTSLTAINVDSANTAYESKDGVLFEKAANKLCAYPPKKSDSSYSIPTGVEILGDWSFFKCNKLTKVDIPDTVTTIGAHCFQNSAYLEEVYLPESITTLSEYAFWSCIRLSKTNIPSQVNTLAYNVFSDCRSLKSIVIPDGVTSIDNYAFHRCISLSDIVIPDTVTSIGNYAFAYSSNLSSVVIPSSVTSIGNNAFYNCTKLKKIIIPGSIGKVGTMAFNQIAADAAVFVMYESDPSAETVSTKITNAFTGVQWYRAQRSFASTNAVSLTLKQGDTYNLAGGLEIADTVYSNISGAGTAASVMVPFGLVNNSSADTYIDDLGVLHIGGDETGPLSIQAYGRTADITVEHGYRPPDITTYYTLTADDLVFPAYDYGNRPKALPLRIHCDGNVGAAITKVELDSDDFLIDSSGADNYVAANETNTTYKIVPKPDLEPGAYTAEVTITYGYGKTAAATVSCSVILPAPAKLNVASKTYNSTALSWSKVQGAEKYQVYRSVNKNGPYKRISTTSKTTLTNIKLTTGKRYYYKIRAYRTVNGKKHYSKFTKVASTVPRPKTPSFTLEAGDHQLTVNWKGVGGASGYKIYRAASKNGTYRLIKDAKASQRSYTSTKLKSKKTYYYKMRTYRIVKGDKIHSFYTKSKRIKTK